jgi:hypothetical protein
MQLVVKQFLPPSRHFILFGPNILLSNLFSNTLSLYSSFYNMSIFSLIKSTVLYRY